MSLLAHVGGVVGCAGLALLLVATRRDLRIAGLVAWAAGLTGLALYLAPDLSPVKLVAAGIGGLLVAGLGGWALTRWP